MNIFVISSCIYYTDFVTCGKLHYVSLPPVNAVNFFFTQ